MPLLTVALGVVLLLVLISVLKLNTFVSLLITAFAVSMFLGMPLGDIVTSIQNGIGATLSSIAIIFGLGAMLGRVVADAGGAHRIAITLIDKFGKKQIQWAVVVASFIIGIALFFEVGLVLLIPIIFSIVRELKVSPMHLGIPMLAALLATHGFLPPHPGPTVIAGQYGADLGTVLLYGIMCAIPAVWIGGPLFTKLSKKIVPNAFNKTGNLSAQGDQKEFNIEETPKFGISLLTATFPVILMMFKTIVDLIVEVMGLGENFLITIVNFIGTPAVAMLLSLLIAFYTMGIARKISVKSVMNSCSAAAAGIGMMLLIIGGGGAFKQVLIDGGVGDYIAKLFTDTNISPIILSWVVAAILRIALGSATVAAISTAGLVIPLLATSDVNLALVTLATGAGSSIASHVNDAGFWMVKEYFGLSLKETFGTWTLLSTVVSVVGLGMVLLLDISIAIGVIVIALVAVVKILILLKQYTNNKKRSSINKNIS